MNKTRLQPMLSEFRAFVMYQYIVLFLTHKIQKSEFKNIILVTDLRHLIWTLYPSIKLSQIYIFYIKGRTGTLTVTESPLQAQSSYFRKHPLCCLWSQQTLVLCIIIYFFICENQGTKRSIDN